MLRVLLLVVTMLFTAFPAWAGAPRGAQVNCRVRPIRVTQPAMQTFGAVQVVTGSVTQDAQHFDTATQIGLNNMGAVCTTCGGGYQGVYGSLTQNASNGNNITQIGLNFGTE